MPTILGANSVSDTTYNVDNSIRLDGTDDHLSLTLTQNGTSQKAFTFSCWVKRSKRNSDVPRLIHVGGTGATPTHYISVRFRDDQGGRLSFYTEAGGDGFQLNTNRLFKDTTGWMHVVCAVNSAATEEIDRQKLYVNGVQLTSMSSTTAMSYNQALNFNQTNDVIYLFRKQEDSDHFPGYACEVAFIDGQQLDPTSFGEFDSNSPNIWKPKDFKNDVTFGNNGFYLEFKDSSDLGVDTSGNGNDLNVYANNQSTDTCTNNFAVLNDLNVPTSNAPTISEGNLITVTGGGAASKYYGGASTLGVSSGKWYAEFKPTSNAAQTIVGITSDPANDARLNYYTGQSAGGYGYYGSNGTTWNNDSSSSYGNSYTDNDIIGVAMDLDNSKLYFSKNGTFQNSGNPASGSTGTGAISITSGATYFFQVTDQTSVPTATISCNFGSPEYSISSGNSDANGHGNFEYAVPSGYFALCTKNIAENG